MKKLVLLTTVIIAFCSCQSKEDKAAKLIKEDMFKSLYDYESYQPIETKLDSAFSSIYTDSIALYHVIKFEKLEEQISKNQKIEDQILQEAKNNIRFYSKSDIIESIKGITEYSNNTTDCIKKQDCEYDTLKQIAKTIKKDFIGWKATHKFRCKNKGGNFDIGNYLYIFDKNMDKIIYKEDTENEDIIKSKKNIKELLNLKQ